MTSEDPVADHDCARPAAYCYTCDVQAARGIVAHERVLAARRFRETYRSLTEDRPVRVVAEDAQDVERLEGDDERQARRDASKSTIVTTPYHSA